ncbi:MAG: hypothetical protein JNM93_08975 [Bacteriovoracaceae bacterium]|nr:hypothetical protein [Bacteriovoracaceae bacterium]
MKMFIHLPIVLVLSVLAVSCNALKEAGENAEKSAQNSGRAAGTGESLHYGAQSKESDASFSEYENKMINADEMAQKTRYAASMIKSLTYQTIYKLDAMKFMTDEQFEAYYDLKLTEDVNKVWRVINENRPSSGKFEISKMKGKDGNIKAIALALHEINPLCEVVAGPKIGRQCSMLEIIKDAYRAKYVEGKSVEELKDYQKVITRNEKEFIYILDLRVKFLPMVAIKQISNLDDGLFTKVSMLLSSWTPNFLADEEYNNEAADSLGKLEELLEMKATYESDYRAAEASGDVKKSEKAKKEIAKIDNMIKNREAKNAKNLEKALSKLESSEASSYEKPLIHDGDLDFYRKIMEKVIADRDFLRSIVRVSGVGAYQKAVPLRFAEQSPLVLRFLKNLDTSELEKMSESELESRGYSTEEREAFINSLNNILNNNKYKFSN